MTQYGFYDNDIMDEVIVSDMIHASNVCNYESTTWKKSWLEDSSWGFGSYDTLVGEVIDMEQF